jgi:hypothetical protein
MRLTWRDIRTRAANFTREWQGKGYEKGQTQLFYQDFFDVFGVSVRRVAAFEESVKKLGGGRGFIDLFWKGVLLVEQKSIGRDLAPAKSQALDYFPHLSEEELPRYILLSDFQTFELYDLDEDEVHKFTLRDFARNVQKFGFIIGERKRTFRDQDPVNIKAAESVGKLHDALAGAGYVGHDLEQFLVRIVFCLFADDTGIFYQRDAFLELLDKRTKHNGSDVGPLLAQLFQVLDTPVDKRPAGLDPDLAAFPYVNGGLFRDRLLIPVFDTEMRARLIAACLFDWSEVSPAIFGSLFQSVMSLTARRAGGAHYTTEQNILKVIGPLFLDELLAEFNHLKKRKDTRRRNDLRTFQTGLSQLKFLDPACGCGNFLVISYRELRLLEIEVIRELLSYEDEGQQELDAATLSIINVDQFFGLEKTEFPVRIAETALWMTDHLMNSRLSLEFGRTYARIPLRSSPSIVHCDALDIDWTSVLPVEQCNYVLGNPPFIGAKMQTDEQRAQVHRLANLGTSGGTLDYVAAWFLKATDYASPSRARIAFVSTNSITQGEQVAQLWPTLFQRGYEIAFAHRTFAWGSDARGTAHVHVVIVGLCQSTLAPKQRSLYSYADISGAAVFDSHPAISPYLFDASHLTDPHTVVREVASPINKLPSLVIGSKPIDGGHYILDADERDDLLASEPEAAPYIRPYVGSKEFINGGDRWILTLSGVSPTALRRMPQVSQKVREVKAFRLRSTSRPTRELAQRPTEFHVTVIPDQPFLVIPEVSSERREYVPIGYLKPPIVPSNLVRVIPNADKELFALLTSNMHMTWLRYIGGRLKSDYRYSIHLVYNTFPTPDMNEAQAKTLRSLADGVLNARFSFPGESLAALYDPYLMPPPLQKAHHALDKAVDALYRKPSFASDQERIEFLLARYEALWADHQRANQRPARAARRASSGTRPLGGAQEEPSL